MTEKEKGLEKEAEALRKAGRDRERDLDTLNTVLQCNQDIINVRTHTHISNLGWNCMHCGLKHTHTPTFLLHSGTVYFCTPMHSSLYMYLGVLFR